MTLGVDVTAKARRFAMQQPCRRWIDPGSDWFPADRELTL